MPKCEDYPCCGHGPNDCPRIDSKGRQRWTCVECYKELPLKARSSICLKCQNRRNRMTTEEWEDYEYMREGRD